MIVVDGAAVVDALTLPPGSEELRTRLEREELHAPALIDYEVLSALRGLTLGGKLSATRADEALDDFDQLPVRRWLAGDGLRQRMFSLRHNVSAFDAAYIALAEVLGCPLITRDIGLARSAGHEARIVVC